MKFDPNHLERDFVSYAPGYWNGAGVAPEDWNDARWQLKNSIKSLPELEQHLNLLMQPVIG